LDPAPDIPSRCISTLDLDDDRVRSPGAVELPAGIRGEGRLYVAGDTLYLHRPWAGALYVLDAGTLGVRETISDVYGIALPETDLSAPGAAAGRMPYVVTRDGLSRLGSDLAGRPVARRYEDSPVELAAAGDRVYVLADGALQIFDADLAPVAAVQEEGVILRGLVLDRENRRLYVGSYAGLYALDLATGRLSKTSADVGNVWGLAVDPAGQRLFALTTRSGDWFGRTDVVAIDLEGGRTWTLWSTHGGRLTDLVYDANGQRVLVASPEDHALIPIGVPPGGPANVAPGQSSEEAAGTVGQRLPLGIEVVEAIVSTVTDRLYVSDSAGWVHVLDRRSYEALGCVYGGRHISLDETHDRLYAGDERVPVVSAFDARSLELQRVLSQAGKPRANPSTGEVVIVNRKFYVYDGASGQPAGELLPSADVSRPFGEPPAECPGCYYTIAREVTVDAQRGLTATTTYTPWPGKPGPAESIDYDPATGRAYYGLLTGGYVRYSSTALYADLSRLQARDRPVLYLEGLGGAVRLDPAARRLYVARNNMLFVLESESLNRVGRLYVDGPGAPWTPAVAAVDGELGRLYLPRGGRLAVWARTGGALPSPLPAEPWTVTQTVASILPSPNYAADGTLLADIGGRLARSTDRGATWQALRGGLPRFGDYPYGVDAAFSPAYATDRRMFAGIHVGDTHGEGVYCSEDGGDTWVSCSDGMYDLRVTRVVPSPNFGQDRTLVAYARTESGEAVYRSADGGDGWRLVVRQTSWGTPPLPRAEELFSVQGQRPPQFRCDYQGACERSDDGGETWMLLDTGGVRLDRYVAHALSPHHARDGTVYFLTESDLYMYNDRSQAWSVSTSPLFHERGLGEHLTGLAAAATGRDAHDLFLGSAAAEFYRLAASDIPWAAVAPAQVSPADTPSPTPCVRVVDPRLQEIAQTDLAALGCAMASARETGAAFQPFEQGRMFWREDLERIYVLHQDGTWAGYEDTWTPEQGGPDLSPPQGLYAPVRGFGRVWSLELEGPPSSIGWGIAPERGYAMLVQPFARGLLLTAFDGELYALYDDGTWETP
jgi:DNA-binding beta-propeller fold protein YncE